MGKILLVNEIFHSIQGESTRTGFPMILVRLTGCNLRCSYCDTVYAYEEGARMDTDEIMARVDSFGCAAVEITGGEPMTQDGTVELAKLFLEHGYAVMMETNGSVDLSPIPKGVKKIVDIKCPGSGAGGSFLYENLKQITPHDELKFVVSSKDDFDWMISEIEQRDLSSLCPVNVSPASGKIDNAELADWILKSGKSLRLNLQLHRILFGDKRSV
ncbi:MAG: radical SAM protein [Nitrospinota bacterium]